MTTAPSEEAPRVTLPREYNAAVDLIERNLAAGRAGKLAFRDDRLWQVFGFAK